MQVISPHPNEEKSELSVPHGSITAEESRGEHRQPVEQRGTNCQVNTPDAPSPTDMSRLPVNSARDLANGVVPMCLTVNSPHGQVALSGDYDLVTGERANGMPLWKQRNGYNWLYSGMAGKW